MVDKDQETFASVMWFQEKNETVNLHEIQTEGCCSQDGMTLRSPIHYSHQDCEMTQLLTPATRAQSLHINTADQKQCWDQKYSTTLTNNTGWRRVKLLHYRCWENSS